MARLPDDLIHRIKTEISLVDLIQSQGYSLTKQGKDYVLSCPFHEEDEPSLVISPDTNLWHCMGACQTGGSVIDWVMKIEKVSFRQACDRLLQQSSLADKPPVTPSVTASKPLVADADDQKLLQQVTGYYHDTLKQSPEALEYLEKRGLKQAELIDTFQLGYANRTLCQQLPDKTRKSGFEIRTRLQSIGLLRESGHEHFNGSLVVPIINAQGEVQEIYGRKIQGNRLRKGTPQHLYLPGTHQGVWNLQAFQDNDHIILCEALIDAMTFWVNGYRNVTASYGTCGFTADHLAAFQQYEIKRVLIAYDRDESGDQAASKLAKQLQAKGMACFRLLFPQGMDANAYAQQASFSAESLGIVIHKAEWMGEGQAPKVQAAKEKNHDAPLAADITTDTQVNDQEVVINLGDRRYRIRGLKKNMSYDQLKINVLINQGDRFYVDTFDLYHARHRHTFIKQASAELDLKDTILKTDLGQVLLKLEALQDQQIKQALTPQPKTIQLTEQQQAEAMSLLKHPDLLAVILQHFEAIGVVGETTNKLVGYLASVSRKLDKPLAIIIQSSSAAGKSSLMDAILNMMPNEECVQYSAMTGQSIYYMGETNLKHKILAISEEEGAQQASYALKLLQSEGKVSIASTGKDAATGNLVTQEYQVEGPVMLFSTTTAIEVDEELKNRCIVLAVDEDRQQTAAIHNQQRFEETLEGLLAKQQKQHLVELHCNAQRLLKPLNVVNPYAHYLTFLDEKTRTRRDHKKYLTLIRAITLLYQYQREIKTVQHHDQPLHYIESTLDDIAHANTLVNQILGRSLDELAPQTRRLLQHLHHMVTTHCQTHQIKPEDYHFKRCDVRAAIGWSHFQVKTHMKKLEELEYVLVHQGRRGQSFVYELLYQGEGQQGDTFLMGLKDINQLIQDLDANKEQPIKTSRPPSSIQVAPKVPPSRSATEQMTAGLVNENPLNSQNSTSQHHHPSHHNLAS